MGSVQGSFAGFPEFLRKKMAQLKAEVKVATVDAALFGETLAIAETDKKGSVDRGQFKNAWDSKPKSFGAEIRNDAPYASFIERGTRPHWVPLLPLALWVNRKFGKPKNAVQIARAIQKKIATEGTKPRFVMKDILPKIERYVKSQLREAVKKVS